MSGPILGKDWRYIKWSLGIIILAAIIFGVYELGFSPTHSNGGILNFETFAPTRLPKGVKETGRSIEVWDVQGQPFDYRKIFRINLNDPHSSIGMTKATNSDGIGCVNPEDTAINAQCSVQKTPVGQSYTLVKTYDQLDKEIFSVEMSWAKDDTHYWVDIRNNLARSYDQQGWERTIDSFVPVSHKGLTIKHIAGGA